MLSSTFFRNFCAWFAASLLVNDVWPFVGTMVSNTYVHNDAVGVASDGYYWDPPVRPATASRCCIFKWDGTPNRMTRGSQSGPELRTGAATVAVTGNHYDGGYASAEIFGYFTCPTVFWVTGSGTDEPEAVWSATWDQATWVDHGAWGAAFLLFVVYPPVPQLEMNVELLDSSIETSVYVPGSATGSPEFDGNYVHYVKW